MLQLWRFQEEGGANLLGLGEFSEMTKSINNKTKKKIKTKKAR